MQRVRRNGEAFTMTRVAIQDRRAELATGWLTLNEAMEAVNLGLPYEPARMPHVPGCELRWAAERILAVGLFGWLP